MTPTTLTLDALWTPWALRWMFPPVENPFHAISRRIRWGDGSINYRMRISPVTESIDIPTLLARLPDSVMQLLALEQSGNPRWVQELLLEMYQKLWDVLWRNSPDAIKADTIARIREKVSDGYIPPYVGGRGSSPEDWVATYVIPHLDDDMIPFAYNINVYRDTMYDFYKTLCVLRSRGSKYVNKFYTDHWK